MYISMIFGNACSPSFSEDGNNIDNEYCSFRKKIEDRVNY